MKRGQTGTFVAIMASATLFGGVSLGFGPSVRVGLGSKAHPIPAATVTGFTTATVKSGSVVWFRNVDGAPHNAIGRGINSGTPVVGVGTLFRTRAPRKAGTYSYICGVHTGMRGLLKVR